VTTTEALAIELAELLGIDHRCANCGQYDPTVELDDTFQPLCAACVKRSPEFPRQMEAGL
jgi:hypothetical protein